VLEMVQQFYTWAQEAAITAAEKALQGVGGTLDVNVCAAGLRLMSQLLNWEFQGTLVRGANGVVVVGKQKVNAFASSIGREGSAAKRPGDHACLVQVRVVCCLFFAVVGACVNRKMHFGNFDGIYLRF